MTEPHADDQRAWRFMPPALRAELVAQREAIAAEPGPDAAPSNEEVAPESVVPPSRAYRFFHAPVWKYAIGWLSLLIILVLFGMMCSPAYWRF